MTLFAQTALAGAAAAAGFSGIYTYDIVVYTSDKFARICNEAHAMHLLCAPSVGPGYDARRGSGDLHFKPRRSGATYDHMWRAAIAAGADAVTITSYNEWHEGTQIEPAAPAPSRHGAYRYLSLRRRLGALRARRGRRLPCPHALLGGHLPSRTVNRADPRILDRGWGRRRSAGSARSFRTR